VSAQLRPLLTAAVVLGVAVTASLAGALSAEPQATTPTAADREDRLAAQLARERRAAEVLTTRLRAQLRAERRITHLVRNPSPANNRELARRLFSTAKFAALDRIAAGGDGLGGRPGESDWRHLVWNGGHEGAWPDRTSGRSGATCAVGDAYGIGQACPRAKMASWAGTPAVHEIPILQLHWMEHYARGRYGSLEAAGAHWTIEGSW
jgi:hypothetical protein